MTRATQALLARALGVPAGTALPAYVQRRAKEIDYYLQESRLPPGHPVVVAHAASIVAAWRALRGAGAMGMAASALYDSMGQDSPIPPSSPRSTQSSAVWNLLSMARHGMPNAERLSDSMLARGIEIDALLRAVLLPEEHPVVQDHVARIVVDSQEMDAGWMATQAAQALKAWHAGAKSQRTEQERREQELDAKQKALDAQALKLQEQRRLLEGKQAEICQRHAALAIREATLDKREEALARPFWKRWWDALQ